MNPSYVEVLFNGQHWENILKNQSATHDKLFIPFTVGIFHVLGVWDLVNIDKSLRDLASYLSNVKLG